MSQFKTYDKMESLSSLWSTVQHEVCNQTDELCQIALCAFSFIICKADSLMVWTTAARVVSTDCLQTIVEQTLFSYHSCIEFGLKCILQL
jgi:hypothetical protein